MHGEQPKHHAAQVWAIYSLEARRHKTQRSASNLEVPTGKPTPPLMVSAPPPPPSRQVGIHV